MNLSNLDKTLSSFMAKAANIINEPYEWPMYFIFGWPVVFTMYSKLEGRSY